MFCLLPLPSSFIISAKTPYLFVIFWIQKVVSPFLHVLKNFNDKGQISRSDSVPKSQANSNFCSVREYVVETPLCVQLHTLLLLETQPLSNTTGTLNSAHEALQVRVMLHSNLCMEAVDSGSCCCTELNRRHSDM